MCFGDGTTSDQHSLSWKFTFFFLQSERILIPMLLTDAFPICSNGVKRLPQTPVFGCRSNSVGQVHPKPPPGNLAQISLRVRSQASRSLGSQPGALVGVVGVF
uniref:Uncharacterized protein n=1 Tax=Romanomermis culicivorax TaxID=13658 RepID=A0A915JY86_ROMCU